MTLDRERNLAWDWIAPGLWVSTGIVATYPMGEKWLYIETFIHSDLPWMRTTWVHGNQRNAERALRAHRHIVDNLRAAATPLGAA